MDHSSQTGSIPAEQMALSRHTGRPQLTNCGELNYMDASDCDLLRMAVLNE